MPQHSITVVTRRAALARRLLTLAGGCAVAHFAAGCASSPESANKAPDAPARQAAPHTEQAAKADLAEAIARDAEALSKLLRDGPERDPQSTLVFPPQSGPRTGRNKPGADAAEPAANITAAIDIGADAAAGVLPAPAPSPAAEPTPTLDQRIERLAVELASRLRDKADKNVVPLHAAVALANLEFLAPGVSDGASPAALTSDEAEALSAWRDALRQLSADLASGGSGASIARAMQLAADRLAGQQSLAITHTALCTRVEAFGRYTPLPSTSVLAGKRHKAIVYTEVDRFTHRPSSGHDGEAGFSVELTQDVSLYHDADGLLAWRRPETDITDFSRNRRRDFFVVQMIELPETLTVGAYRLKITMRDKATGAIAESILPIDVVADPALTRQRTSGAER